MQNILLLVITILTAASAQLLFKKGVLSLGGLDFSPGSLFALIPRVILNGWLISGVGIFGVSFLLYLFVLSKYQINVVYPIVVGSGIVLITLASWSFFAERVSLIQALGISLILIGMILAMPKSSM